jgi:ADP-heptose:LPS heptosyltransferase
MAIGRRRLLILRALGIGDLLTAVPAIRALARAFPEHERALAAPESLRPLIELVDSETGEAAVDRIVDAYELGPLAPAAERPDVAVNLHGRGPQSHRLLLAQRPRQTLWFESEHVPESAGSPRWRAGEHEVDRWSRLLSDSGLSCRPDWLALRPPSGEAPGGARGATVLHPGAASAARRWPAERFAEVARAERERGYRVVITGANEDAVAAREIGRLAGLPATSVLAGRTDLGDLSRVIAAAGRVVCGDTGVAHLATAFGTPSVVLFGPCPPAEWGPPPARAQHRALWAGRRGDPHGDRPHAGLLRITPAEVIRALDRLTP